MPKVRYIPLFCICFVTHRARFPCYIGEKGNTGCLPPWGRWPRPRPRPDEGRAYRYCPQTISQWSGPLTAFPEGGSLYKGKEHPTKKNRIVRLTAALCAAALLAGCGSSIGSKDGGYYAAEAAAQESYANYDSAAGSVDSGLVPENAAEAATDETAQKIIYNASLSMESTDFDTTREALMTAVEANGAWLESTSLYGTEKDHDRTADYTVRVPVGSYRAFLAAVGDAGSVLNISESAENITSSYIDVQARLSALEAQRDRLNALADQAETTADLLEIESQLSDVQYQLENYTRQLRSMDQQVSYSTVDIYLREVATLTPTGVTFGERIADAFGGGWDAFVGFLQGLVIALVYLWPVLLIAAAVVFILRKVWKKRPKKEKLPKPAQTPPPAEYPVKPGDEPKPKY